MLNQVKFVLTTVLLIIFATTHINVLKNFALQTSLEF